MPILTRISTLYARSLKTSKDSVLQKMTKEIFLYKDSHLNTFSRVQVVQWFKYKIVPHNAELRFVYKLQVKSSQLIIMISLTKNTLIVNSLLAIWTTDLR